MRFHFSISELMPFAVLSIPIIAIIGGIVSGILRTMGRQRIIELAQRERIAAIERGLDPSKLPPLPGHPDSDLDWTGDWTRHTRFRAQGLMVGGIITLAVGVSMAFFLHTLREGREAWGVGLIPMAVGLALLLSAWLVRPRNGDQGFRGPKDPQGPPFGR